MSTTTVQDRGILRLWKCQQTRCKEVLDGSCEPAYGWGNQSTLSQRDHHPHDHKATQLLQQRLPRADPQEQVLRRCELTETRPTVSHPPQPTPNARTVPGEILLKTSDPTENSSRPIGCVPGHPLVAACLNAHKGWNYKVLNLPGMAQRFIDVVLGGNHPGRQRRHN